MLLQSFLKGVMCAEVPLSMIHPFSRSVARNFVLAFISCCDIFALCECTERLYVLQLDPFSRVLHAPEISNPFLTLSLLIFLFVFVLMESILFQ